MRKVVYFHGGNVADFDIPDEFYTFFAERKNEIATDRMADLEKARCVLENVMAGTAAGEDVTIGENEILAAAFVWNHFNTQDEAERIDGDVIIVDAEGDGNEVTYMPLSDVELSPAD